MNTVNSKLFGLKDWFTVSEAARHLSKMIEEEVTEGDIFQFFLEKRLKLSVNFVNPARGRKARLMTPEEFHSGKVKMRVVFPYVIEKVETFYSLSGIFDLIGDYSKSVIKEKFSELIGGPPVTELIIGGAFVEDEKGEKYELVDIDHFPDNKTHRPAGLPLNSIWVVRKSALIDFQKSLAENDHVIQTLTEISSEKKSGKPKGPLNEAIEYAYRHFIENGDKEILKPGRIGDFLKSLKDLHEKGNGNISEYLSERIEKVKISKSGNTITTQDKVLLSGQNREITIKPRCYKQNAVSKILTLLRKNIPLNP
ncbi:MAG: hypothetical protein HY885_06205 [Deltaproteobacteria bacterium]|nr:hypothetical protein [Deltaproteobacteria bacterium]